MLAAFIHGLILAFSLITPLGVLNVYIFNQGASQGNYWRALPAIVAASLSDTILITLAVTGVSVLVFGLSGVKMLFMFIGVGFLSYMGWQTWRTNPSEKQQQIQQTSAWKTILFTASITLFNPHAIIDTIGVIGTSALEYSGQKRLVFTFATILISWLWFFGLALVGRIVGKLDTRGRIISVFNKVSAIVMWAAALYLLKLIFKA
jgi:L-lysine exporter family protein LysE/ArgO